MPEVHSIHYGYSDDDGDACGRLDEVIEDERDAEATLAQVRAALEQQGLVILRTDMRVQ